MSRLFVIVLCGLSLAICELTGCASSGLSIAEAKPFGRTEQWEPDIEEPDPSDWKKAPASVRKGKGFEDPMDRFIMSDTARDIERSVGGNF